MHQDNCEIKGSYYHKQQGGEYRKTVMLEKSCIQAQLAKISLMHYQWNCYSRHKPESVSKRVAICKQSFTSIQLQKLLDIPNGYACAFL